MKLPRAGVLAMAKKSRAAQRLPLLHLRSGSVLLFLASVPVVALALVTAYVPRVAIHISAVAIYVAIFTAQFLTLVRGGPIVALTQIAAQLPAVMRDLGFVAANVAQISAPVGVIAAQVPVAMVVAVVALRHHAARARKNQKHQPCQSSVY